MQLLNSNYRPLIPVTFPQFKGRQLRYHTFNLENPDVPPGYGDYLSMVRGLVRTVTRGPGVGHLTIDEKVVLAGMSQRRPKPHVDGCFRQIGDQMNWGGGGGAWLHYCNDVGSSPIGRMPVIVAASVAGCKAWIGKFLGRPAKDGDLSHISDQLGQGEVLPANMGYLLSPDCVHESMVFDQNTLRSFIRIALPASLSDASVAD